MEITYDVITVKAKSEYEAIRALNLHNKELEEVQHKLIQIIKPVFNYENSYTLITELVQK